MKLETRDTKVRELLTPSIAPSLAVLQFCSCKKLSPRLTVTNNAVALQGLWTGSGFRRSLTFNLSCCTHNLSRTERRAPSHLAVASQLESDSDRTRAQRRVTAKAAMGYRQARLQHQGTACPSAPTERSSRATLRATIRLLRGEW